jgi:hypothetical protein
MFVAFVTAAMIAAFLLAAQSSIDGKWEAKLQTQVGEQTVRMTLKTEGEKLTGTLSTGQGAEMPFEDGRIAADTLTFKQSVDMGGTNMTFTYTGKVKNDQIVFTREPFKIEFTAKRTR